MNEPLHITLLGGLEARQGERVITRFKSQKTGALLAYLAYHLHQTHSRERLIDLFWPESTLDAGRNSLSVALSTLRHQLEPPGTPSNAVLRADRFAVGLNPAVVSTDVARFEETVKAALKADSPAEQTQRLAAAADLYRGRLLPGFYEEWITGAQERLAGLFLDTLNRLISRMETSGDLPGALEYARRAVALDPLQEQAQQHLIRLLAANGQPGAALRQYKEMERLFDAEMGEEPSAPLRALAREIEKQSGFAAPLILPTPAANSRSFSPPPDFAGQEGGSVTLTFLMTDIQGSTRLWERAGEVFQKALESHHTLLRREFVRYGGQEIAEAGDSFVVAFSSVGKAVNCAIAGQQALIEHAWPEETGPLRVRMALHTGDVEYQDGDYHGLTLHRASRMLTTGHGGQILCSEVTASLARRNLDEAARLVDLGVWRLRDVPVPEQLFQVEYPGMPEQAFPPLTAESGHTARLPLRFTRFFGRNGEIARLIEWLRPNSLLPTHPIPNTQHPTPNTLLPTPNARLVTLTGSGGAGKTRLAIEVAERLLEPFQGAVWFAPLADITDSRLIADTILDSLRLVRSAGQEPLEQVVAALVKQPSLLVLDNFEQIVEGGAALVQTLLSRLPTLTILVTSRQLLGLSGEQEFVVPPLLTPNGGETAAQLSLYDSVQLFVDRAQTAMPHFQITSGNAPAVAELCHRLEGIPLAIELAAARALVLAPGQMLKQLEQRFGFLVSRKRDATERHRTLQAAVEWSYRLLTPELQRFFTRLSVFRGGWTAEAAEAICEEPLALDYLAQLRECSLVLVDEAQGNEAMRFRMLETLREYADEQLMLEELMLLQEQHTAYFVNFAEEAEEGLWGMEQQTCLDRLESEHSNMRAVLQRGEMKKSGSEAGLRMTGALYDFWRRRGYTREGLEWSVRTLEGSPHTIGSIRAKALRGAGSLALNAGDKVSSHTFYEQELAIRREIGDKHGIAEALNALAAFQKADSARSLYEQALTILEQIGNKRGIGSSLLNLGIYAEDNDDFVTARSFYNRALAVQKDVGYQKGVFQALTCLGRLAKYQGNLAEARRCAEERLSTSRACGSRAREIFSLGSLGHLACEQRDIDTVRQVQEQCQTLLSMLGNPREKALALDELGHMAMRRGDYNTASDLLEEGLTLMRQTGEQGRIAGILSALAEVARIQGEYAEARRLLEEEASICRLSDSPSDVACNLDNLGSIAQAEGNYTTSHSLYSQALIIRREMGIKRVIAYSVMNFAGLAMARGQRERAIQLWGAAEAIRTMLGLTLLPTEQKRYDRDLASVHATLDEETFGTVWKEGQAMPLEQAVDYALEEQPV